MEEHSALNGRVAVVTCHGGGRGVRTSRHPGEQRRWTRGVQTAHGADSPRMGRLPRSQLHVGLGRFDGRRRTDGVGKHRQRVVARLVRPAATQRSLCRVQGGGELAHADDGARVGAGHPGERRCSWPIPTTQFFEKLDAKGYELIDLTDRMPLGLGTPRDIGEAVVYLASDAARWVTGQTITISGGLTSL